MEPRPRRKTRLGLVIGGILLVTACSASKSCSCVSPIPSGFTESQRHDNFVQARVTRSGLDFFQNNFSSLVSSLLPGGSPTFTVPPSGCGGGCGTSSPCVCCGASAPDCVVDFSFDTLHLTPEDATTSPADPAEHTLNLDMMMDMKTDPSGSGIKIKISTFLGDINCNVTVDTFSSDGGGGPVDINSNILFNIPSYDMTRLDFMNFMINNFQSSDYSINGGFACSIADFFKSFFTSTIVSTLQKQAQSAVENQLCEKCPSGTTVDCSAVPGVMCKSNACDDTSGACVQKLGLEGAINAGSLLAKVSPGLQATIDAYDVAGGYAKTNMNGLSLGLTGGDYAAPHSACVPMVPPPAFSPDPPAESGYFDGTKGDVDPMGNPFDLGIGLHLDQLTQLGHAAFDSGAICADVGTRTSPLLNSDTFSILVPSLADLLHGDTVPLLLELRPQEAPVFKLGLGTFTTDPKTGMKTITDPLITITLPKLQIDFYAFIDQRYVRIFTLQADLVLPLVLDVESGSLVPILGSLKDAFQNVTVTNSYLLSDSPSDIAMKFPAVVSVALPFLTSALAKGFPLPSVLGLKLQVNDITSVDQDPSGAYQLLGIFASLMKAGPARPAPGSGWGGGAVHTVATLDHVDVPPTEQFRSFGTDFYDRGPAAYIDVDGTTDTGAAPLEYHYRIDGGLWSPWSEVSQLVVRDPAFYIQGTHRVEVQGRVAGDPASLEADTHEVDVTIDTVPPKVWLARDGWNAAAFLAPDPDGVIHHIDPPAPSPDDTMVELVGHDSITPDAQVQYRVSVDGGSFTPWSTDNRVQLPRPLSQVSLVVQARDLQGNISSLTFHSTQTSPETEGCAVAAMGGRTRHAPIGVVLVLALLALAGTLARRRRRAERGEVR